MTETPSLPSPSSQPGTSTTRKSSEASVSREGPGAGSVSHNTNWGYWGAPGAGVQGLGVHERHKMIDLEPYATPLGGLWTHLLPGPQGLQLQLLLPKDVT